MRRRGGWRAGKAVGGEEKGEGIGVQHSGWDFLDWG